MDIIWHPIEVFLCIPLSNGWSNQVINRSMGDFLWYLVEEKLGNREYLVLSTSKFDYGSFVNRSTSKSLFEIVHGLPPRQPIDLLSSPVSFQPLDPASLLLPIFVILHANIRHKLYSRSGNYTLTTKMHCRAQHFTVDEYVMVHICPERYLKHSFKKLHGKAFGVFSYLR